MRNLLLLSGWYIKNIKEEAFKNNGIIWAFSFYWLYVQKGMGQGTFQRFNNEIGDAIDILFIVLYFSLSRYLFKPIISSSPLHAVQAKIYKDGKPLFSTKYSLT